MSEPQPYQDSDRDSLHTLPLAMIPLATPGLAKARLVKNARLEGMIELFSGAETGSGQILPCDLVRVFHFDATNRKDLEVVESLAGLPSYDVFSLRGELRRLGIAVDESRHLHLSAGKKGSLNSQMRDFTRPLVAAIYGRSNATEYNLSDIVKLFAAPEAGCAQRNLRQLAQSLDIEFKSIPGFLEDYGDTYLPLAYFESCLDMNRPVIKDFMVGVAQIQNDPKIRSNAAQVKALIQVQGRLMSAVSDIVTFFEVLKARTWSLWTDIDKMSYRKIKRLIESCIHDIGKALCAITVKMAAWKQRFPRRNGEGLSRRADFIMSDIKHGIESIQGLSYARLR